MQIQRIQSVFLLLGALIMGLLSFAIPIGEVILPDTNVAVVAYIYQFLPTELILNLLTAVLLFVAIFLYRNLPLQIKVTRIAIVLTIVSGAIEAYELSCLSTAMNTSWIGSAIMLAGALILSCLALYCINKDKALLASVDRIR